MGADDAIALIGRVGLIELFGTDGCMCMHGSVQGVDVDVSCCKSSGCFIPAEADYRGIVVRCHSGSMDETPESMLRVADFVAGQIEAMGYQKPAIRGCDYDHDKEQLCVWCDKPRQDLAGYYCSVHQTENQRGWTADNGLIMEPPK